jgi:hypothetical protein
MTARAPLQEAPRSDEGDFLLMQESVRPGIVRGTGRPPVRTPGTDCA